MNMKRSIIALFTVIASSAVFASADINITPAKNGAWVEITKDGLPVESAVVNEDFITNENGRVFIYHMSEFSKSVGFSAVTPDGETLETEIYLRNNGRNN